MGLIRTDTLNYNSDPVAAINNVNNTKTIYSSGSVVKNGIDETLVGLWKYHDAKTNADSYYKFLADGTFEYYTSTVTEANKMKGINRWKIEGIGYDKDGGVIDLTWAGAASVLREGIAKKNDPVTGKPAIVFILNGTAMLISADNKVPWKQNELN